MKFVPNLPMSNNIPKEVKLSIKVIAFSIVKNDELKNQISKKRVLIFRVLRLKQKKNMSSLCTYRMHILESAQHAAANPKETRKKTNDKEVVEDKKQNEKNAEKETTKHKHAAIVRADDTSKSQSSNSKSSEDEKPKVREGAAIKSAETTPEPKAVKHKEGGKSSNTASKSKESIDEGNTIFNA